MTNIKPSFELMQLNYNRVQEYSKNVPEIKIHLKGGIDWCDMIKLELHIAINYHILFFKQYDADYLIGKKEANWLKIHDSLLKEYIKIDKIKNKHFLEEYTYYNSEEHSDIKNIIKNLKKMKSEEGLKTILKNHWDYRTFDIDAFYIIKDMIFNYCINNDIKCDIIDDDIEFNQELEILDLEKIEKLRIMKESYDKAIDEIVHLLKPFAKEFRKNDKDNLYNFYNDIRTKIEPLIK